MYVAGHADAPGHLQRLLLAGHRAWEDVSAHPDLADHLRPDPLHRSGARPDLRLAAPAGQGEPDGLSPTTTAPPGCRARARGSTPASTTRRSAAAPSLPASCKPLASLPPHRLLLLAGHRAGASAPPASTAAAPSAPAVPIYNLTQCVGIHGHVKVAPDGTAYVPNKNCGGSQGRRGQPRQRPDLDGEDRARQRVGELGPLGRHRRRRHRLLRLHRTATATPISRSRTTRGDTWTDIQDVGTPFGLQNIAFPAVVAGDPDRAAFAFLGTATGGDLGGEDPTFPAVWHLYVAHTYDGGAHLGDRRTRRRTIRCSAARSAPPAPPAAAPATCSTSWTPRSTPRAGSSSAMPTAASAAASTAAPTAARRWRRSPASPAARGSTRPTTCRSAYPAAPYVQATQSGGTVHVTWSTPDDHGAPILGYHLSRRPAGGSMEQFLGVGADVHSYDETPPAGTQSYSVKAVNAQGESPACGEATLVVAPPANQACTAPGVRLATDPAGDSLVPALDVQSLSIAEPPTAGGSAQDRLHPQGRQPVDLHSRQRLDDPVEPARCPTPPTTATTW